MCAFHIGRMLAKKSLHLLRIPIDHLRMHRDESAKDALFDDLQIVPVGTRLDVASEVGLALHMQAPVPRSPPSPHARCLSHQSPELVASGGERAL
jgi:hypothetical protein